MWIFASKTSPQPPGEPFFPVKGTPEGHIMPLTAVNGYSGTDYDR